MSKRMKDEALSELLHKRNERVQTIRELKYEQQEIENDIVINLLRSNDTQYLKVDWAKLNRKMYQ